MSDPQDPFEMFRRLWGPLGVPVPGMAMPTLDPQELEKRINELKSVEVWLSMATLSFSLPLLLAPISSDAEPVPA